MYVDEVCNATVLSINFKFITIFHKNGDKNVVNPLSYIVDHAVYKTIKVRTASNHSSLAHRSYISDLESK